MSAPMTPEEMRRQMRERFDAANAKAEQLHNARREAGDTKEASKSLRWARADTRVAENAGPSETHSPDA